MRQKNVRILSGSPGKRGSYLGILYQPSIGKYFAPLALLGDSPSSHETDYTGPGIKVAIVDSGFMLTHPFIQRNVQESIDFTGEGPEDLNGHGTIVALTLLLNYPRARLFNVKVVDAEGRAWEKDLIKGIEWSMERATMGKGPLVEPFIINLSVGVYHKRWGLWDCGANCDVCKAAIKAALSNVGVVAAAGNEPGITYCPAKAGVLKKGCGVTAVAAYDLERGAIAPYSGIGTRAAPVGTYVFGPVE